MKKQRTKPADQAGDDLDFSPALLDVVNRPPPPLSRWILYTIALLLFILILWAVFGQLDIVARAEGKLVPQTRLKIVQPFEDGRVAQIRVREDEFVKQGQLLLVMDSRLSDADGNKLQMELQLSRLRLRSIEAELENREFDRLASDSEVAYDNLHQQFLERRKQYAFQINQRRAALDQARQDLEVAREIHKKLEETLPIYRANEEAVTRLGKKGYVTRTDILDKQRLRIETEQDLRAQEHKILSVRARIDELQEALKQLESNYRQELLTERIEIGNKIEQLEQDWFKQQYRNEQLELRASQDGYIKDLSVTTPGSVVPSGTVLLNIVPVEDPLLAEVYVSNRDIGFVKEGQRVRVKLMSYEFQKYGMIDAEVQSVNADVTTRRESNGAAGSGNGNAGYKTLIKLHKQILERDGRRFRLRPGMQVTAEVKLGTRSVLDYVLSPITGALTDAATER
ncbi:HlyD family type I secretion periplasmic adaptor subunit [Thiohalophilus sp.]|uniref:HlyD family type I secretion periplasmic adaptor subunit n=1 Tax=Thiohalophilus sp. TaxID=3028392 RepID=UPI002ACE097C|nr:HlyD family type I secretion periplasmic adaptor subunit [Thiohalophilus sp.]MDZ7805093.1 HlyD family type I secretion periplasmic adaptor subunit [Thiohalophilus sp.]